MLKVIFDNELDNFASEYNDWDCTNYNNSDFADIINGLIEDRDILLFCAIHYFIKTYKKGK